MMKNTKRKLILTLASLVFLLFLTSLGIWTHYNPGYCQICDRGSCSALKFGLTTKFGIPTRTCCPRCAIQYMKTHPGTKASFATDFKTGKKVDISKVTFVDGSDVRICHRHEAIQDEIRGNSAFTKWDRCLPSLIAFESEEDALSFQKDHGGKIQTMEELKR
ncbi:hypothetical protein BVX98_03925 [bacterium F11]|nr:hypothetical protein BVX98_03925 [bacterium F11]